MSAGVIEGGVRWGGMRRPGPPPGALASSEQTMVSPRGRVDPGRGIPLGWRWPVPTVRRTSLHQACHVLEKCPGDWAVGCHLRKVRLRELEVRVNGLLAARAAEVLPSRPLDVGCDLRAAPRPAVGGGDPAGEGEVLDRALPRLRDRGGVVLQRGLLEGEVDRRLGDALHGRESLLDRVRARRGGHASKLQRGLPSLIHHGSGPPRMCPSRPSSARVAQPLSRMDGGNCPFRM